MKYFFIILSLMICLPHSVVYSETVLPGNQVEALNISDFRLPTKNMAYNFGFSGSSDGRMYSWVGATKRFMPSSNLLVDMDVSFVRQFGENQGNYILTAGKMTYFMSNKLTLNVSFIAPAIKIDGNSGVPGSW